MPPQPDLHRPGRVHLPLIGQVSPPMRGGLLGPQEMIDLGEHIRMGVEMQEADRLSPGDLTTAKRLYDIVVE